MSLLASLVTFAHKYAFFQRDVLHDESHKAVPLLSSADSAADSVLQLPAVMTESSGRLQLGPSSPTAGPLLLVRSPTPDWGRII